jgi:uncharacterized protein YqfB (UPF0267 family)
MATSTTEQDFFEIKENLKTYLRGQTEFADYDFEGSAMSTLLDVLAFNTHYAAMTANMSVNEMFLDTAQLRSNVVSHARTLGYTPQSPKSSKALVSMSGTFTPEATLNIPRGSIFNAGDAKFITLEDYISNSDSFGAINFDSIKLHEGKLLTKTFIVTSSNQKFTIPNKSCDISSLRVSVKSDATSTDKITYSLGNTLIDVGNTSKVYFLEESDDEKYSIYFGDNLIGKKLDTSNVVVVEYIKTIGIEGNSIKNFSFDSTISDFKNSTVTTISQSSGGSGIETINSIKINAPFNFAAQNRAVTISDYRAILKKIYPNSDTISVWGGEDNIPPEYGKVFICIKPENGEYLSTLDKNQLQSDLVKYKVSGINVDIIDAEYLYIDLTVDFDYNSLLTTKSIEELKTSIQNIIDIYNHDVLTEFGGIHRNSNLTTMIDSSDNSIMSSRINHKVYKTAITYIDTSGSYKFLFGNKISNYHIDTSESTVGMVFSNKFNITGDTVNIYYFKDDGKGNIILYKTDGINESIVNPSLNHGSVNYNTGEIVIEAISISGFPTDGDTLLRITTTLNNLDINPTRNNILKITSTVISGTEDNSLLSPINYPTTYATTPRKL